MSLPAPTAGWKNSSARPVRGRGRSFWPRSSAGCSPPPTDGHCCADVRCLPASPRRGLAALTLAFGLAGGGPLGSNETPSAGQDCHYVSVKQRIRVREPFVDEQGRIRVRSVPRLVERQVKRR